jgi:HPt (histidine-containing phosphotransfer) domain-containing protein
VNRPPWILPDSLADLARSGATGLVAELLDDFRTDVAVRLARLRTAVASGDAPVIKMEVHSIKGSAAQMGADGLAGACLQLEAEAATHHWNLAPDRVEPIQQQFDQVCEAMRRHPLGAK